MLYMSTRLPPSGLGSNLSVDAICGLSLLSVLVFVPEGFSPGALIQFHPPVLFLEGLIYGGKFARFKINWASLTDGSKFIFFALFFFVFEGN